MQKSWYFLSDIEGVYKDKDDPGSLISELHVHEAEKLISEGYVGGGMIPKLQNCIDAIEEGVNRVHILGRTYPAQPPSGDIHKQRYRNSYFERRRGEILQ